KNGYQITKNERLHVCRKFGWICQTKSVLLFTFFLVRPGHSGPSFSARSVERNSFRSIANANATNERNEFRSTLRAIGQFCNKNSRVLSKLHITPRRPSTSVGDSRIYFKQACRSASLGG